ncbi:UNVERIFIED_CONTAM: hypothetical protein Sindi_2669200 [Sesamum indicum]
MGCSIKIAVTTLELDKENFIKLVELSLERSVKIGWDNNPEDIKARILVGDSKGEVVDRLRRPIKIHFIGDGYFEGSRSEKAREYNGVATDVAAPMFFAKICSPWREILIKSYKVLEGQLDSVAQRMSFLKDKLKDRCYQASIQKNMKRLRGKIKRTPLCCDNNDFSTIIKESSEPRKRRKKKIVTPTLGVLEEPFPYGDHGGPSPKLEHINLDKEQDLQKFHPKDLDEQMQDPLEEPLHEELPNEAIPEPMKVSKTAIAGFAKQKNKYSRCSLNQLPDCPQKRGELRKFEARHDILDAVYYGDLVPIYQFEDLPSDESVYEEKIETDLDGSSIESE